MACEQEEGCLCLTKKKNKKRETEFFCTNTRDSSSRKEKDTRSWKGILVSYFSSWQKQMELAQYHAADPFLIFFSFFFSLFLCCGQDRWQARTIFRGPLVLIVQCSYWNLYTRQSRILGVQKKKSNGWLKKKRNSDILSIVHEDHKQMFVSVWFCLELLFGMIYFLFPILLFIHM